MMISPYSGSISGMNLFGNYGYGQPTQSPTNNPYGSIYGQGYNNPYNSYGTKTPLTLEPIKDHSTQYTDPTIIPITQPYLHYDTVIHPIIKEIQPVHITYQTHQYPIDVQVKDPIYKLIENHEQPYFQGGYGYGQNPYGQNNYGLGNYNQAGYGPSGYGQSISNNPYLNSGFGPGFNSANQFGFGYGLGQQGFSGNFSPYGSVYPGSSGYGGWQGALYNPYQMAF